MVTIQRKKSPRAPTIALDEALDRALKAYDKERLHSAPVDVVAQNIGYKGANSGSALQSLASLRYYGLMERPKEGVLAVAKEVESFRFSPSEKLKKELLAKFLKSPPLFAELLEKYSGGLPSDANLKHELITQRHFAPLAAESVLVAFKRSVAFAGYFDESLDATTSMDEVVRADESGEQLEQTSQVKKESEPFRQQLPSDESVSNSDERLDRIPVRLPGNRRAWLLIPVPFYEADKARLKAQIDLLLAADES